jgi:ribokinase
LLVSGSNGSRRKVVIQPNLRACCQQPTTNNQQPTLAMQPPLVIVIGSYVQDHCWTTDRFPAIGETRVGHFSTGPGGKGFNQAIACHRQGVATEFVGALGADALADIARRFAADEGLVCHWQTVSDLPTATSSIVVDAAGRNLIVVDLAANLGLEPSAVAQVDAGTRVVLTQLETKVAVVSAALARAREVGALAFLNPAPLHPDLTPEVLALADLITPNETEFALLLNLLGVPDDVSQPWQIDELDLHALCRTTGVPTVVITLGEYGCFVSHGRNHRGDTQPYYRLQPESVRAIDTTGAGDAFSGALAAALAFAEPGAAFREAVVHANRVAAMSTEQTGTAPAMPTRAQVAARFP